MDKLKDIVKKYSTFDVDANLNKTLNSNANDTFISNQRVDETQQQQPISLLSQPQQQQTGGWANGGGNHQQSQPPSGNDIAKLEDGITSLQLIRYGLMNTFGQQATMKISNMLGADPTPYLLDEQNLKSLLLLVGSPESRAQYFINWLKTNAHYVAHPVGFLSYGNGVNYAAVTGIPQGVPTNYYATATGPQQPMYGSVGMGGPIDQIDEMDKFYYDIRVYQKGLPPNHPINRQNLDKYKEEKREEEQLKMIDRRTNIAMRTQMLKSFSMMGGEGNQNNNSIFSPEMMVMTGNARWEIVGKREDGSNIYQVVPNVGPQAGGVGGYGQQQMMGGVAGPAGPLDQMSMMMNAFKSMMEVMQTMAKPPASQESFLSAIMQGVSQKLFQPPTSQLDDLGKAFDFFSRLKGEGAGGAGGVGTAVIDPTVAIETKRMETDKDFGMKILELKDKELQLKARRLEEGDKEAASNINTLIGGLQTILPELINVGKSLFLKGGQPGGAGAGGLEGMIPGGAGGESPMTALIKMEHEKNKQKKMEEARRAELEWQEELRRKNAEDYSNPYRQQGPYYQQKSSSPQPETQKVVIQQPPEQQRGVTEDEERFFNEDTYIPYAPRELEQALKTADRQIEMLEKYKSTVGSVLQEKIANGENIDNNNRQIVRETTTTTAAVVKEDIKKNDTAAVTEIDDYLEYLDSYPSEAYDPDYQGPSNTTTTIEEEKKGEGEGEVGEDNTVEKEEVDI